MATTTHEPAIALSPEELPSPSKHHSQEADELDFLCLKLSDVRVRNRVGVSEEDIRLSDVSTEKLHMMLSDIMCDNSVKQRDAVILFRKLLAHEDIHPYLDRIISSGVLPYFVTFLSHSEPELQFEAAWILTNIAAGTSDQTAAVVHEKAIAPLVDLVIHSPHKEIKEQAIWCLGNIAGDCSKLRTDVLSANALQPVIDVVSTEMNEFIASSSFTAQAPTHFPSPQQKKHNFNLSTLRIAIWALSNLCRGNGKSEMDWELVHVALPILREILICCTPPSPHSDDEILMDACWALSRTLRGLHEQVTRVIIDADVCEKLGHLICCDNPDVQIPALRCLINIVSGCDDQTQIVLDAGLLPFIHKLLLHPTNETVRKEACLIVSNITAGTRKQVQAVLDNDVFPTLVDILRDSDFKTKREACWAISNGMLSRDPVQVRCMLSHGILEPLLELLRPTHVQSPYGVSEDKVAQKALEALKNILIAGDIEVREKKRLREKPNKSDIEMMLLQQFESMTILESTKPTLGDLSGDSAYNSSTDLYANDNDTEQNPFAPMYLKPLTNYGKQSLISVPSGVDLLKRLAEFPVGRVAAENVYSPSPETCHIANEIINQWF